MQDICLDLECQERLQDACPKQLECGHSCPGFKGEEQCPECFHSDCKDKRKNQDSSGEDYCNICFVEALENAPIIRVGCGHIFHLHCLTKRIELRWVTARIVFTFCTCPLCKVWMVIPPGNDLTKKV